MQSAIQAISGPINTQLNIPGSKKISNRALMIAALADGVSEISGINFNEYTKVYIHALQQTGIVIQTDESTQSCIVAGCNGKLPKTQATIWCGDVETAARYLLTACAAAAGVFYFDGTEQLRKINIENQVNMLCIQGAQSIPNDNNKLPITLVGADSFEGGEFIFEKNTLSSVLTAFLLLSPYARTPFSFTIPNNNRQNYINMTCEMMAEFGVLVRRIHRGQFMVPVPQRYHARDYNIEPDVTLLAFFFAAVTVCGGELGVQPFKRSGSKQLDVKSLRLFENLGCIIHETTEGLTIKSPLSFEGQTIHINKFSSGFAALLSVAPFANSPTKVTFSKTFKIRKHQWLQNLRHEFSRLGIRTELSENEFIIYPGVKQGGEVNTYNDPFMGMIFAVIGLRIKGVVIYNIDYLNRLYPDFLPLWHALNEPAQAKMKLGNFCEGA